MIQKIKEHAVLSKFIDDTCCEEGICVSFEENISPDSYVIIKVDKYYNSLNIKNRPASVDCLIIRKCLKNGYGLTLVELKKTSTAKGFDKLNIKEKFETTLFDFIRDKFNEPLNIEFKDVKLYFVSKIKFYKRDNGLKMDFLMNIRFKFNNRKLMIHPKMPNPTIKNCY